MLALAAAPLGLRCHVYSPEKDSCAFDVVQAGTCASYDDETALARFAGAVDVITYEFENVPAKTAAFLARRKSVLPDPKVLETTQDRLIEKNFVSALKIATAPYASVHSATQLAEGGRRRSVCRLCSRRGNSAMTAKARRRSPKAATRSRPGDP